MVDWPHEGLMKTSHKAGLSPAGFRSVEDFLDANKNFSLPPQEKLILLGDANDRNIGILILQWVGEENDPQFGNDPIGYKEIWPEGTKFLFRRPKK